ncbi:MAG: hypothetical protein ACK4WH_07430 [Phycisphaerales bacterium]
MKPPSLIESFVFLAAAFCVVFAASCESTVHVSKKSSAVCPDEQRVLDTVRKDLQSLLANAEAAKSLTVMRRDVTEFQDALVRQLDSPAWVVSSSGALLRLPSEQSSLVERRMSLEVVVDPVNMLPVRIDLRSRNDLSVPEPVYESLIDQLSQEGISWSRPRRFDRCIALHEALRFAAADDAPTASAEQIILRRVGWTCDTFTLSWLTKPMPLDAWLLDFRGIPPVRTLPVSGKTESFMWTLDAESGRVIVIANTPKSKSYKEMLQ